MTLPTWKLFLDDERDPGMVYDCYTQAISPDWTVARSTEEAKLLVRNLGIPAHLSLDHDLGGEDTTMDFLKWLANEYWTPEMEIPTFKVHSANPVGKENIISYMNSWRKSTLLNS